MNQPCGLAGAHGQLPVGDSWREGMDGNDFALSFIVRPLTLNLQDYSLTNILGIHWNISSISGSEAWKIIKFISIGWKASSHDNPAHTGSMPMGSWSCTPAHHMLDSSLGMHWETLEKFHFQCCTIHMWNASISDVFPITLIHHWYGIKESKKVELICGLGISGSGVMRDSHFLSHSYKNERAMDSPPSLPSSFAQGGNPFWTDLKQIWTWRTMTYSSWSISDFL